MSTITQGSVDDPVTEKKGNCEKPVVSPPRSTGCRTQDDLLGDSNDDDDRSSTNTMVMDTNSDNERNFNPGLPTGYEEAVQAAPEKDAAVNDMTLEMNNSKSEKVLPASSVKHSMQGIKASKSPATQEIMIVEPPVDNDKPNSSHQDEDKAADDMLLIRML